jgi:hypothetical protein
MSQLPAKPAASAAVAAFLARVNSLPVKPAGGPPGRLLFLMDAPASRQPRKPVGQAVEWARYTQVKRTGLKKPAGDECLECFTGACSAYPLEKPEVVRKSW